MFANSQGPLPAMGFSFPDVLLTPFPLPPFLLPIPFPNISLGYAAIPTCFNVFYMCMPAHNMITFRLPTIDGIGIGVASGTDMGPGHDLMGSTNYFVDCMPQTKMIMPILNNLTNAPGLNLSPAQIVLLTLS